MPYLESARLIQLSGTLLSTPFGPVTTAVHCMMHTAVLMQTAAGMHWQASPCRLTTCQDACSRLYHVRQALMARRHVLG